MTYKDMPYLLVIEHATNKGMVDIEKQYISDAAQARKCYAYYLQQTDVKDARLYRQEPRPFIPEER